MGAVGFVAAVLFVLMGMGHWKEHHNVGWLLVSLVVAGFAVAGALGALFKRDK